jgi:hypothetical protein
MNRGPLPGKTTVDYVSKAEAAYGGAAPDWVLALADEMSRTSGAAAARKVGYSQAVLSTIISGTYRGNRERVAETVRGALMGATVTCPVLGDIGRDRCLDEQRQPFRATSAMRARLYHACRACPHAHRVERPREP